MTLRNTSAKFGLPSFGRKSSGITHGDDGSAPQQRQNNGYDDDVPSPQRESHGGGTGGGGGAGGFAALGGKLGKTIAHQSLLPALGNQDMRLLQDVISSEKSVLQATDRLAIDTAKSAVTLPAYGAQEGPDLQDVLTHSSTLLSQLSSALHVFAEHQATMRQAYKRIRQREEQLDELRRRRRNTGAKAEQAEKKLAKMGPENKGLPQQTELLERLRQDMRQMDTDIITEEAKIGDFKRQIVKEALSLKFGGLEELGEKMCIIGELGKLLLEEIPLEETPPGYGRAPYNGYDKTENAVNEAVKCLATVQFHAASANPKPPSLPNPIPGQNTPPFQRQEPNIAAAEEYANYPGNVSSPTGPVKGKGREYSLDDSPYGGIGMGNPYDASARGGPYDEYGGMRGVAGGEGGEVVWQGPTEEALARREREQQEEGLQSYEYEQQQAMDRERREEEEAERAWRDQQGQDSSAAAAAAAGAGGRPVLEIPAGGGGAEAGGRPWEPLNVKRGNTPIPPGTPLHDGSPRRSLDDTPAGVAPTQDQPASHYLGDDLPLPSRPAETPGLDDFHTPLATPEMSSSHTPPPEPSYPVSTPPAPAPPPPPAPIQGMPEPAAPPPATGPASPMSQSFASVPVGGKISAAAFRKAARARGSSTEPDSPAGSEAGRLAGPRRLPVPPIGNLGDDGAAGGGARMASPAPMSAVSAMGEKRLVSGNGNGGGGGTYAGETARRDDVEEGEMPPSYGEAKEDSLR